MKPQDLLLIILAVIVFWPDSKDITHSVTAAEGMVAMQMAYYNDGNTPSPNPNPNPSNQCDCNGTKRIKSGDGLINIPCPCGPSCPCSSTGSNIPDSLGEKNDSVGDTVQILYLTSGNCGNCMSFESNSVPDLKAKGWGVTDSENSLVRKVDISQNPEYTSLLQGRGLPLFIKMVNGQEVRALTGYATSKQITDLYYQEE